MRQAFNKNFALITILIVLIIVYGSLFPFAFRQPPGGIGPVMTLVQSWANRPGRGDFISNILLYLPLGVFGMLAARRDLGAARRIGLVVLLGALLSASMELIQYYDAGRDTEATDLYSNVAGTLAGAVGALWLGSEFLEKLVRRRSFQAAPTLLLAAWVADRLYPFVPVIDLHKYWDALKPVILAPSLTGYDLFRHLALWITAAALFDKAVEKRWSGLWFAGFAAFLLLAKVFVIAATLSVAEIAGAALATCWLILLSHYPRFRTATACAILAAYVIASRLEPFHFQAQSHGFGWIPFLSLMRGSVNVDVLSLLEKFFLYGSLIWLLTELRMSQAWAILIVAAMLFATSWAEIYLPGRSAEITDTIIGLMAGLVFYLVRPGAGSRPAPTSG